MKKSTPKLEEQALVELQKRLNKLQTKGRQKNKLGDELLSIKVQKSQARFKRIRSADPDVRDVGQGMFFFLLDITAYEKAVYIPISIASGKKTVGFIYQIEGTAAGEINTTDITCRGDGVTKITLGTLLFAKVPAGKTASFRLSIEIKGRISKEYRIVLNQISYKLDPGDARYQKLPVEIATEFVKFL